MRFLSRVRASGSHHLPWALTRIQQAMPTINSRGGGSECPADHAHGIVYSRDASSAFILGKRASAIAASAAGRRRGNGRGGRRSDDTGRQGLANRKGKVKAGATGSASKADNHRSQGQLTTPRG